MKSMYIEELEMIDVTNHGDADRVYIAADDGGVTGKLSVNSIVEQVKRSMGYLEKPLVKCRHCGQWGAAYCACRHCGAPIDPE